MYPAVLTTTAGCFPSQTQFFPEKQKRKSAALHKEISLVMKLGDFSSLYVQIFSIEISPKVFQQKPNFGCLGHNNRSFSSHSSKKQYSLTQNPA